MDNARKLTRAMSIILVALGLITLGLNLFLPDSANVSWPLAVIMLSVVFFILTGALEAMGRWSSMLFLPGSILLSLGLVFLVNVLTADWAAWAYAWLLVAAGAGLGLLLVNRSFHWREWINLLALGLIIGGITLFVLFGALAGGRFILVTSPIVLIAGGVAIYFLRPELVLPSKILARLRPSAANTPSLSLAAPDQASLSEPLSLRELEVLRLVDEGLSNAQIAERLTVAPSTVKTHINNIYGKLSVESRLQAVKKARDLGLLSRPA